MKKSLRAMAVRLARLLVYLGWRPPERVFRHLHFEGPFTVVLPGGTQFTLYSWGSRVENEMAWRGWNGHEPVERARWLAMVKEGGDCLDIGANTGTFAFTAKAAAPESRVVAFEPLSRIADRIDKNIAVSGLQVDVVRAAVSSYPGELPIYDPGGANAYSASLEPDFLSGEKKTYTVPVVSIDSYCINNAIDPSVIKIDVEGAEGKAILGARKLISRRKAKILCEWLGNSEDHRAAVELLTANRYAAIDIHDLSDFDLLSVKGYADRNVLIAPREDLERYQSTWTLM